MNLSALFIRRPIATSLLALAVILAGIVAYGRLPVAPLPRVDFPTIQVNGQLPGASPETMASAIATPLERRFGRIAGVTEITSVSALGSTSITLQFELDRDVNAAARDVQAAINAAGGELPANMPSRPNFRKVNPTDAPIMILALTSKTIPLAQVFDAANTVLAQRVSQVPGVGQVYVGGGQQPAVRVQVDPRKLASHGLSLADVRLKLASSSSNAPKGTLQGPQTSFTVAADSQLFGAEAFGDLILREEDAAVVRLRDVANVFDDVENRRAAAWFNAERAVVMIIRRQPGANILAAIESIKTVLPELRTMVSPAIDLTIAQDRASTIRASVADVEHTLVLTVGLVVLVVAVFLRTARATAIPSIAVPISLVGTFGAMWLLDYSLDNLSLMALTIATGFVVDDAIVVTENVMRHLEEGKSPYEAALIGAREIGFTILSITVSLLAVFIPLLFMGGIVGRLFREFSVTLAVSISVSALVSLTVTPMMCATLLRPHHERTEGALSRAIGRGIDAIVRVYDRGLRFVFRHRTATLLVTGGTLALTVYLYVIIPKGLFPQQDVGLLAGFSQASQDVSFLSMRGRQEAVNQVVLADPDVSGFISFTGGSNNASSGNTGAAFIQLKPKPERKASAGEVIGRLRPKLAKLVGVNLFLQAVQDVRVGGRASRTQYQYTLQTADLDELRTWSPKLVERLRKIPDVKDVTSDQQTAGLELGVVIDRDAAARFGIRPAQIDDALYDAFGQRQVATSFTDRGYQRVVMEVIPELQQSPDALSAVYVASEAGAPVPMANFARIEPRKTSLSINHQGQFPAVTVSFNLAEGKSLSDAVAAIERAQREIGFPASIHAAFQGTAQAFSDSTRDQPLLILGALVAVYIVLGVLYESTIHPLTILSTLPSAGVGALLALLLFKEELNVIALVGILLLIGIVKKNAIMLVDFAIEAEHTRGLSPLEAIHEACLLRFRPILMTTLAALFGGLPLALGQGTGSELRRPLGIAIVGGLLLSQLLTLYTTPVVYLALDRFTTKRNRARPDGNTPPASTASPSSPREIVPDAGPSIALAWSPRRVPLHGLRSCLRSEDEEAESHGLCRATRRRDVPEEPMRTDKLLTAVSILSASALALAVGLRASSDGRPGKDALLPAPETGPLFHFPLEDQTGTAIPSTSRREAPLSLTASDGTGLTLTALDARAVIEGPLAFTELRLTFENPLDRTLEGTFRITLPPGAAVSRFAMKLGDVLQEGEVVEKQAARRAYEDFLHRRQDPALLEQAAGNEFSARVFPIPARGKKELVISFSQELVGGKPYALALRGLPSVGKLDAIIAGTGDDAPIFAQLHTEGRAPDADLEVDEGRILALAGPSAKDGIRSGDLALVRVRPAAETSPEPLASCVIMVDTSASRALGFAAQTKLLADIVQGLGNEAITVAAFDQGIDVVYQGPASGFATAGTRALLERGALGASHLDTALEWASLRAKSEGKKRVVLLTDGVATAGETDPVKLRAAASSARDRGVERIDAIAMGGIRDDALLRELTTAGLARDGMVIDGTLGAGNAKRRLDGAVRSVEVGVKGAEWHWPERLTGLQASDEGLVFVKMAPGSTALEVTVTDPKGGRPPSTTTPHLAEVKRPLLERAWVGAKINQLVQHPPEGRDKASVDAEIVKLSTSFRVLSPLTALLVLETENDYARYKIERTALADILAIDGTKLTLQHRTELPSPTRLREEEAAQKGGPAPTTATATTTAPMTGHGHQGPGAGDGAVPPAPQAAASAAPGAVANTEGARGRRDGEADEKADAPARVGGGGSPRARRAAADPSPADQAEAAADGFAAAAPAPTPAPSVMATAVETEERERAPREPLADLVPAERRARPMATMMPPNTGTMGRASGGGAPLAKAKKAESSDRSADKQRPAMAGPVATMTALAPRPVSPPPGLVADRAVPPRPIGPKTFGPYQGPLAEVMELLANGQPKSALARALAYHRASPGEVLALVALGECFEALGEIRSAARAYGSLIDLFPDRADLRRMAGERLEHLKTTEARYAHTLAADSYAKAVAQRPDHPSSHRLLAYARLRAGDARGAFDAMEASLERTYPVGRFAGVDRILREDLGLIGAAWKRQEPGRASEIEKRLADRRAILPSVRSLRFVLVWETDNNDVDFHIYDNQGNHAYYGDKNLATGGSLYADVTTGFGPECFTVEQGEGTFATPYRLEANYFSRGPMGYGMGKLEIIEHDGKGNLTFDERPYVIMVDHASVPLGSFPAATTQPTKPVNILDGTGPSPLPGAGTRRPELPRP